MLPPSLMHLSVPPRSPITLPSFHADNSSLHFLILLIHHHHHPNNPPRIIQTISTLLFPSPPPPSDYISYNHSFTIALFWLLLSFTTPLKHQTNHNHHQKKYPPAKPHNNTHQLSATTKTATMYSAPQRCTAPLTVWQRCTAPLTVQLPQFSFLTIELPHCGVQQAQKQCQHMPPSSSINVFIPSSASFQRPFHRPCQACTAMRP